MSDILGEVSNRLGTWELIAVCGSIFKEVPMGPKLEEEIRCVYCRIRGQPALGILEAWRMDETSILNKRTNDT